jgi:hypothetical protein
MPQIQIKTELQKSLKYKSSTLNYPKSEFKLHKKIE